MSSAFPNSVARRGWLLALLLAGGASVAHPQRPLPAAPAASREARPASALQAAAPHPAEVFGFEPGADYKLADHSQIVDYFRRLDRASDRVLVREIGRSVLGRPLILAFISSAENISRLEQLRAISTRLARAADVPEEEARRLAAEGKAVVWIDGGLHATEVAGAQQMPLLAYLVATEESEAMRRIRQEVVLLLMPVMNPDGLDITAGWYRRHLGTPFETSDLPWLYHHYVGHDNNRDFYMLTQPESRAVARLLYHEWYPQIVYNHHQTAPFPARIFVPPFADPVNPNIPPLVTRGVNLLGSAMTRRFAEERKPGPVSRVGFDMWWNGGMRTAPYFHNMVGILTETALYRYATPKEYSADSLPRSFGRGSSMSAAEPSVFYPDPWRGGWWRLGDAVDYMITASLAVLETAAALREEWLYNIYRMGRWAIEAGQRGSPFAFVIPSGEQWDAGEAAELVRVLRWGGIDVTRAAEAFEAGGKRFAAGSYVIYTAQAFRAYILDLLEKQVYPDMRLYAGGPPAPPYDMTGWTLPIQMGVRVERVEAPFRVAGEPVAEPALPAGRVTGEAAFGYVLSHRPNASALAINRLLRAGERVAWAREPFQAGGATHDAGAIVVRARGDRTRARVEALSRELGLDLMGLAARPAVALRELRLPRVALYKSWVANMDEGWTRWLLERYEFALDTLHDGDIRRGQLSKYDAIVLPDQSAERILNGHRAGSMPAEYVGGLGVEGAAALKRYVAQGGRVVALDGAANFVIEQFGLPLRDAVDGVPTEQFFVPGSLLRLAVDPSHPVGYGMPAEAAAFFVRSRAFDILEPAEAGGRRADRAPLEVVAHYPPGELLLSGWALGEKKHLGGKAAVVRAQLGSGDVVLIGFRSQFRGQPRATFKLLFNALHGATLPDRSGPGAAAAGATGE
ncbi:MAG: peptidase M14 [Gemmatimonadetes bacterium]|nr:peptidase M14 [Gemmatimonadota bacterium]